MANLHAELSFLDLPREIRDQIYEYCVVRQVDPPPPWNRPCLGSSSGLLRVCKKIHTEAATIFYGRNVHIFFIGWRRIWENFSILSYVFEDTTAHVAPQNLRMIKSCILLVNPTLVRSSTSAIKNGFLKIKASVQTFADSLSGRHSLKELQIVYTTEPKAPANLFVPTPMPASIPSYHPHDWVSTDTRTHLLEPLAYIYGIPRVSVAGCRPDIAYRLEQAMSCSQKAVSPYQEIYRTRMVKAKGQRGKKKPQAYCVSKYYESKIVWNTSLLGPLPPITKLERYK